MSETTPSRTQDDVSTYSALKSPKEIEVALRITADDKDALIQDRFIKALSRAPGLTAESVRYLDKRKASFLVEGYLVQTEVRILEKAAVFWCLFFEGDTPTSDYVCLDIDIRRPKPIELVIHHAEKHLGRVCVCFCTNGSSRIDDVAKHLKEGCADIDHNKVHDYALEFLNYADYALEALNENGETSPYVSGLLAHDPKKDVSDISTSLNWWPNDLMGSERKDLNSLLSANPLSINNDTKYSKKLSACVLAADVMVRREYRVFTAPNRDNDPGSKGQVTRGDDIEILLRGLPPAVVTPGAGLGFLPRVYDPTDKEEWQSATELDMPTILESLSDLKVDMSELEVVQGQRLDFYGLDLLELQRKRQPSEPESSATPLTYILWQKGFVKGLDGTSGPIYEANEFLINGRKRGSDRRLIKTEKDAAEYARFFGRHVSADEGPFILLTSAKDKTLDTLDLAGSMIDAEFNSVRAVLETIKYPEGLRLPLDDKLSRQGKPYDEEMFAVDAWVLYGTDIFRATFLVCGQGTIEMMVDNQLLAVSWADLKTVTASVSELESKAREFELSDHVISGQLTSEKLAIRVFRHCRFRGRINLQHLVSDRLSFEDCLFENGLDLSGARVEGRVSLVGCLLLEERHYPKTDSAQAFHLEGLRAGQLEVKDLLSASSLTAASMRINGAVQILNTDTHGRFELDWLAAQSVWFQKAKAKGDIGLQGCVVDQFMYFDNVQTVGTDQTTAERASINLYGSIVTNNYVLFENISLDGDLCARFLRVGTGLFLDGDAEAYGPSRIGGSVELAGAKLPEMLRIRNTNVGKSIDATGIVSGAFRILGPSFQPKRKAWTARTSSVGDKIDLTDAVIDHDVTIVDVSAGEKNMQNASLVLCNAKVHGNVNLFLAGTTAKQMGLLSWPDDNDPNDNDQSVSIASEENELEENDLDPGQIDFSSRWIGGIDLSDSSIGGDLDLTSIKCPHGDIKLTDARVERNIILRRNHNSLPRDPSEAREPDPRRTEARSLIMTSLECKGTTDITGVTLTSNGRHGANVSAKLATFGKELNVSVRNEVVESALKDVAKAMAKLPTLCKDIRNGARSDDQRITSALKDVENVIAHVTTWCNELRERDIESALYDCLDLSGSTIGELSVSVNEQKQDVPGVILQYAHVNKFTAILRRSDNSKSNINKSENAKSHNTKSDNNGKLYPQPIDLRFAEIKWWDFDPPSTELGEDFNELLKGAHNLQRHTFRSIEQNLFNQGQDDAADDVHKEMRNLLPPQGNGWTRFWWWVWDTATNSTTSPKRLIWTVIGWFAFSVYFFLSPANIAPSAEGLAAHRELSAASHPPAELWGLKGAVWTALRYHVPVRALTAEHEWQPANHGRLTLQWLGLSVPGVNAEDYANIVLAFHWIFLPIILILLSRKFLRRVEK